jgi:hypothetical protein
MIPDRMGSQPLLLPPFGRQKRPVSLRRMRMLDQAGMHHSVPNRRRQFLEVHSPLKPTCPVWLGR